jgi:hypothetical protein
VDVSSILAGVLVAAVLLSNCRRSLAVRLERRSSLAAVFPVATALEVLCKETIERGSIGVASRGRVVPVAAFDPSFLRGHALRFSRPLWRRSGPRRACSRGGWVAAVAF